MSQFNIVYIRFHDFDSKSYVSSQIELCRSLNNEGISTTLIGLGRKKREEDFIELFASPDKPALKKILLMLKLFHYRKNKGIIVFDNSSVISGLLLRIYQHIFGAQFRIIMDIRSVPVETQDSSIFFAFKKNIRISTLLCNGFTFITEGVMRRSRIYARKDFRNYHIFPSGTNTDIFKPLPRNREFNTITAFYHGSLTSNRGILQLIDAIEHTDKEVKLLIAGSGEKAVIEKIKTSEKAEYLGRLPYNELPALISDADFTIIPLPDLSWWRISSPLKLFEYMACAKPILLTRIEAHKNVIQDSKGVVWMDDICRDTILRGIDEMILNLNNKKAEASALRDLVLHEFTYQGIARGLIDYYRSIL